MASANLKARKREDYKFSLEYRTRWLDNDMYDHMNNSVYYLLFDSVVNKYLIDHCFLHPPTSTSVGLVVHSHCDYISPTGFPATVDLCLRVNKLGKSSVTYEIGVFERGVEEVKAVEGATSLDEIGRYSALRQESAQQEGAQETMGQTGAKVGPIAVETP
ncbi:hypothetical protein FKW77_000968 [Venturia effusa]|uniref:Thioesterase domain-containing protein n=1 Tax=Venturia effusa TaxID=50376 RepID=A0A517LN99_9PEZI|nr:hypothetical protein FKW77_000968 [Venturia effusa]